MTPHRLSTNDVSKMVDNNSNMNDNSGRIAPASPSTNDVMNGMINGTAATSSSVAVGGQHSQEKETHATKNAQPPTKQGHLGPDIDDEGLVTMGNGIKNNHLGVAVAHDTATATNDNNVKSSNSKNNYNHAKYDDWHDMGRRVLPSPSSSDGNVVYDHNAAIERNSCMLEDLLITALEFDARMAAASSSSSSVDVQNVASQRQQRPSNTTAASNNSNRGYNDNAASCSSNCDIAGGETESRTTALARPQDRTHTEPSDEAKSSLPSSLRSQIRAYVTQISLKYHRVGFHSFEHASHVMLSATKIVYMLQKQSPLHNHQGNTKGEMDQFEDDEEVLNLVDRTIYDPWLHFAIALSALLHDVDHKGLPNNELLAESDPLAKKYGSEECMKSYAEWNSVEIGLSLLRGCEEYAEFAAVLGGRGGSVLGREENKSPPSSSAGGNGSGTNQFLNPPSILRTKVPSQEIANPKEERFYKMVTDLVLCTDIASKERRELGMLKWKKACERNNTSRRKMQQRSSLSTVVTDNTSNPGGNDDDASTANNTGIQLLGLNSAEATSAISEQIMQAADVSHTMQHFSTFVKWNSHLYHEVLAAYQCGRTQAGGMGGGESRHPKENWYASQIGFFDHYVIPLAERLDACGAFSEEQKFAPLAVQNKESWLLEGEECTRILVDEAEEMRLLPPMPVTPAATESVGDLLMDSEGSGGMTMEGDMSSTTLVLRNAAEQDISGEEIGGTLGELDIEMSVTMEENHEHQHHHDRDDISLSSVPGSVQTSGRVSFAATGSLASRDSRISMRKAAESLAMWGSCSSAMSLGPGESLEQEVDSSVNAIVPRTLVRQLIDTLQNDVESAPPELHGNALRESIVKYKSEGSIQRHRGALLFVDISGFTHLSQNYPVEDFKNFINRYFTKIIDLVISFGGEVVKFAGDALYALWATSGSHCDDSMNVDGSGTNGSEINFDDDAIGIGDDDSETTANNNDGHSLSHATNIEKCTLCAIAINATCNNFKVSKFYNTRQMSDEAVDPNFYSMQPPDLSRRFSEGDNSLRIQGEVLYNFQDKNAEYEEMGAALNVYCGVSEGVIAGVDVVASNRAEFFLVGKPLKDVAKAEYLAGPGELVVSPSVYEYLQRREAMMSNLATKLVFAHVESGFQLVSWPNHPTVDEMLSIFEDRGEKNTDNFLDAQSLIKELVQNTRKTTRSTEIGDIPLENTDLASESSPQSDLLGLLEYHRHEAARDVVGRFTAELRKVVVLFISIKYEPNLPISSKDDSVLLENFQRIFSIISESVSSRSGQVRQFINDDKGTVFIASFCLRGSVVLHPSETAVEAAKEAQNALLETMEMQCSVGITLGKIFCGETGSFQRYEYSLLGPSVNLSARLMAKGAWGQINCDEELRNHAKGRRLFFKNGGFHKLKGYEMPVPFFVPIRDKNDGQGEEKDEDQDDVVTYFMQKAEVLGLVDDILEKREQNCRGNGTSTTSETQLRPRIIIVEGDEGRGKNAFIAATMNQPALSSTSVIMEANRCFHDDPFYCFIPIITMILLSFSESRDRLVSLKKRQKGSSILSSFLANDVIHTPPFPRGTAMVESRLKPFLSLVNGFVFKGFPLLKSSPEAKRLKDSEKVEKCVEVLSSLIVRFLELKERPGIISVCEMDSIDIYSKKLLHSILSSDGNLLIIGGAEDLSVTLDLEPLSSLEGATVISSPRPDQKSTFDLFRWSLSRQFPREDFKAIDSPDVVDKIFQLSGGMTHATAQLAHTFGTHYQREQQSLDQDENNDDLDIQVGLPEAGTMTMDFLSRLRTFLDDAPSDFEEIICFRIDQMKPEEQMLLKIASVAGFDQFSFSQNLLETVLLAISRNENSVIADDDTKEVRDGHDLGESGGGFQVPKIVGGDVPTSIETSEENKFSYLLQGDYFERTLDSLVEHRFFHEVNVEMSDLSSMDSVMYRFRNNHEQSVINGLMLNDQKKRTHFEVAAYYSSSFSKSGDSLGGGENDSSSLSTDITNVITTNWELSHIIALHYDLAEMPIPAMLHYYDSSASLSSLGLREKAHGRLLSAYLMLEKTLHYASTLDVKLDEADETRRRIAGKMVQTIGNDNLKESMKILTKHHLQHAFAGDIFAFKNSLVMLTKFGQSVGTIEEDGYLFRSELYLQAILLVLLVLEDGAFANLTSSLDSFLGQLDIEGAKINRNANNEGPSDNCSYSSGKESCFLDFEINDLTVSFPAFSGLLTFYRDSAIGANEVQETFLANLFVAVTQEANQTIHVLRTKCILSHLYLKHGNISKALEECEGIKDIYDHDTHSLELVNVYGMDWSLICVAAMASTYLYRGQFAAARRNIEFLKMQMTKLDEFASSTKAMSKGTVSSFYLLLHEFDNAAEIASGISATQYGYFFKPIGTMQEELANRELALHQRKVIDSSAWDLDLLSILSSSDVHNVNQNRTMLQQSVETLSDRGIEAIRAALCATEIQNLELQPNRNADVVRTQVRYCQAGLAHLRESLSQKDANNHERRKNYMMCLYQQAHLLCSHHKLLHLLQDRGNGLEDIGQAVVDDVLDIKGAELELARKSLDECIDLSISFDYPFMQLLAGKSCVKLGFDISSGEALIQRALECIDSPSDREVAKVILSRIDDMQVVGGHTFKTHMPPSCQRGVPSAA